MTLSEAMKSRHSVRSYLDKPIPAEIADALRAEIERCNAEGDLHIQLITDEPRAFDGMMAHYGKFSGVSNYIALVGKKSAKLDETLGYYGERVVLLAETLGLNTCWVALSFSKGAAKQHVRIAPGEKMVLVISIGFGAAPGTAHKSKPMGDVAKPAGEAPDWFTAGVEAALLAPTAVNQQQFRFTLCGDSVKAESLGGFYAKVDLGIAKYHFELGAGKDKFQWA